MKQVNTQLAVKILFDDYSGFLCDEEDNYFTREADIIINIVYDLYMTWIRVDLEYLHKKGTSTKLYCLNVKRLFSMFL